MGKRLVDMTNDQRRSPDQASIYRGDRFGSDTKRDEWSTSRKRSRTLHGLADPFRAKTVLDIVCWAVYPTVYPVKASGVPTPSDQLPCFWSVEQHLDFVGGWALERVLFCSTTGSSES